MWCFSVILLYELDDALCWAIRTSWSQSFGNVQLRKSLLPIAVKIVGESFLPFIEEFVGVWFLHDPDILVVPKSVS